VGAKGKHKGSHGIYPCATIRRINSIKQLMSQNYTIEEIQRSFTSFKVHIEEIETSLEELLNGFEREIARPRFDHSRRRDLARDIDIAKKAANDLVRRIIQIETQVVWPDKSHHATSIGMLVGINMQRPER